MPISVGVFKVEKFELRPRKKTIRLRRDAMPSISEFTKNGLPNAETILKVQSSNDKKDIYVVKHFTDTVKGRIRVYWDRIHMFNTYQEYKDFVIVHDKVNQEMFVSGGSDTSKEFLKRANSYTSKVKIKKYKFNLDFLHLPEILTVHGMWNRIEQSNISCTAKFGSLGSDDAEKNIIAINMEVNIHGKIMPITISLDGQISSPTKHVTIEDIIWVYNKLKEEMLKPREVVKSNKFN